MLVRVFIRMRLLLVDVFLDTFDLLVDHNDLILKGDLRFRHLLPGGVLLDPLLLGVLLQVSDLLFEV